MTNSCPTRRSSDLRSNTTCGWWCSPSSSPAAEVGHLELAYDYLAEAALVDLHNLARNTGDGLHMASLAGAWSALVAGFGGMRASPSDRKSTRLNSSH